MHAAHWLPALIYAVFGVGLISCISPKKVVYFQEGINNADKSKVSNVSTSSIQSGDQLSVIVASSSQEVNELFNQAARVANSSSAYVSTGSVGRPSPGGFLVDTEGNLTLPLLGAVPVGGLSTLIAADTIKRRLEKFLKNPFVSVKKINFSISVLGEVNRPALYYVSEESATLAEVLSMAGDLTIYGRRNNITVIREQNGERIFAQVDLTSRDIFDSPYYFMQRNDIVYVEPAKSRMTHADRTMQLLPLLLSTLSVATVLLTRFF